jgi:Protein of unknown function (DUF1579)
MMSRKFVTTCCAILLIAASATAQDSTQSRDGAAGGGGMPPMGPPPEMKELAGMLGTWTADFQMRMDEKAPWVTSPATLVVKSVLGGAGNEGVFTTSLMGMEFVGISRISYNRNTKKWQSSWIDNMGAYQVHSEGDFKDGKLVLVGKDIWMGKEYLMRETTTLKSATEVEWLMEASHDGGKTWYSNMKGTYTKQ